MAGFYIENFGCRAARADGEAVADRLRAEGLSEAAQAVAEVVIVNTCSVTAEADRSARAFIRRTNRKNPEAKIVVTGCYAQRAPDELAALPGVRSVVGNSHKALAPAVVEELVGHTHTTQSASAEANLVSIRSLLAASPVAILADDKFAHSFIEEAQIQAATASEHENEEGGRNQTRPNLKIQEGCDNRCTFCVIPTTRGSSRSLGFDAILRQAEGFVASGGNELVISGINLGRWGRDLIRNNNDRAGQSSEGPTTLAALVRALLERTKLPRLRLSSIEPMDWTDELIALMAEHAPRIARHAHVPLQSGSDAVLRRMHRRYRPWHYVDKIESLVRAIGPELTVGADVMVGFPGETDTEFEESVEMIRQLPFGYLHLFTFSPRPGTPAWKFHLENPAPSQLVEERMAVLRSLAAEKVRVHRAQFVGQTLEAITLHTDGKLAKENKTSALSDNFIPLALKGAYAANQMLRVRIEALGADGHLEGTQSI